MAAGYDPELSLLSSELVLTNIHQHRKREGQGSVPESTYSFCGDIPGEGGNTSDRLLDPHPGSLTDDPRKTKAAEHLYPPNQGKVSCVPCCMEFLLDVPQTGPAQGLGGLCPGK